MYLSRVTNNQSLCKLEKEEPPMKHEDQLLEDLIQRADMQRQGGAFEKAVEDYVTALNLLHQRYNKTSDNLTAQGTIVLEHWHVWYHLAQTCTQAGGLDQFWTNDEAALHKEWLKQADHHLYDYLMRLWPFAILPLEAGLRIEPPDDHPIMKDLQPLVDPLLLSADVNLVLGSYNAARGRYRLTCRLLSKAEGELENLYHCNAGLGYTLARSGRKTEAAKHLSWVVEQTDGFWGQVCQRIEATLGGEDNDTKLPYMS